MNDATLAVQVSARIDNRCRSSRSGLRGNVVRAAVVRAAVARSARSSDGHAACVACVTAAVLVVVEQPSEQTAVLLAGMAAAAVAGRSAGVASGDLATAARSNFASGDFATAARSGFARGDFATTGWFADRGVAARASGAAAVSAEHPVQQASAEALAGQANAQDHRPN